MSRPLLKTADLLLQERLPKTEASVLPEDLELEEARPRFGEGEDVMTDDHIEHFVELRAR